MPLVPHVLERDPILRPFWAGERGDDRGHIESEAAAVVGSWRICSPKQSLFLRVAFDEVDCFGFSPGAFQVPECFVIHGKEAHGGSVLGSHIGECGSICE